MAKAQAKNTTCPNPECRADGEGCVLCHGKHHVLIAYLSKPYHKWDKGPLIVGHIVKDHG